MLRDPQISTPTIRTKSCIELLRIVVVESAKKAVRNIEDRAPGRFNSTFWGCGGLLSSSCKFDIDQSLCYSVIRLSSNEDGFLGALDEIRHLAAFICESWKASI